MPPSCANSKAYIVRKHPDFLRGLRQFCGAIGQSWPTVLSENTPTFWGDCDILVFSLIFFSLFGQKTPRLFEGIATYNYFFPCFLVFFCQKTPRLFEGIATFFPKILTQMYIFRQKTPRLFEGIATISLTNSNFSTGYWSENTPTFWGDCDSVLPDFPSPFKPGSQKTPRLFEGIATIFADSEPVS